MGSKRALPGLAYDHFAGTIFDTNKNKNKNTLSDEDIAAVFTEMQLDVFRNDPIYQAAFDHGDFGDDIMEADFDTFADIKTYIADTIFATDDSSNKNVADNYEASGDYPEYVDVSDYFEFGKWTPPKMYAEPADIEMPSILQKYNTYEPPEGALELLDHTHEDYPVNYEDSGMLDSLEDMEPAHQNKWRSVYTKSSFEVDDKSKNFAKKALQQIGMKGNDEGYAALDKWMQVAHNDPIWEDASGKDLNSKSDLSKFKEITKKYNYTLPEGPTW